MPAFGAPATAAAASAAAAEDLRAKIEALRQANARLKALEKAAAGAAIPSSASGPDGPSEEATEKMDIVFVAAEVAPWSKTGGLGDVMAALPVALAKRGHRVMVVTPRYMLTDKSEEQYQKAGVKDTGVRKVLDMHNNQLHDVGFYHCHKDHVDWVFVDHISYHRRGTPYGGTGGEPYSDNLMRFALLCMAACEAPLVLNIGGYRHKGEAGGPYGQDILFAANDWHTGLLPVYVDARFRPYGVYKKAKCVMTLHNIAHQGQFTTSEFSTLGLPDSCYKTLEWLQPGKHNRGKPTLNLLKGAIVSCDQLVTVSQRYAWDISYGTQARTAETAISFEPEIPRPAAAAAASGVVVAAGSSTSGSAAAPGQKGNAAAGAPGTAGAAGSSGGGSSSSSNGVAAAAATGAAGVGSHGSIGGGASGSGSGGSGGGLGPAAAPATPAGTTYVERLSRLVKRDLKEMSLVGCGASSRAAVALDPSARAALRWTVPSPISGPAAALGIPGVAGNGANGLGAVVAAIASKLPPALVGAGLLGGGAEGKDAAAAASSSSSDGGSGAATRAGRVAPGTVVVPGVVEEKRVIPPAETLRAKHVAKLTAVMSGKADVAAAAGAGAAGGAGGKVPPPGNEAAAVAADAAQVAAGGGAVLSGLFRERSAVLRGIVNGVDTAEWDPSTDPHLRFKFDHQRLEAKVNCKLALQRELKLPLEADMPMLVFIGRLDYQKGPDLVLDALDRLVNLGCQVVLLGSGAPDYEARLAQAQQDFPYHVRGIVGFDVPLSHRLLAAGDVLLMPSRFEPCGLNQMHAMRYGCVPVAHCTGGLSDTIDDVSPFSDASSPSTSATMGGTGWTFAPASADALVDAVSSAVHMLTTDKVAWQALQRRGMTRDFSWSKAAVQYESLFLGLMGHPVPVRPPSAASTAFTSALSRPQPAPSAAAQQQGLPSTAVTGSAAAAATGTLTAAKAAQAIEQSQRQSEWLAKQAQGLDLRQQAKTVLQGLWVGLSSS